MKRTCNNCYALSGTLCTLRFQNEPRRCGPISDLKSKDHSGFFQGMKPSEECPKPTTTAKMLECLDQRDAAGDRHDHD